MQAKLLTVLQDRKVLRVGGTRPIPVDCRIISATNRDLEQMVRQGLFREELFYRINVVPIPIPSLRARADDIPFLIAHFLERYNTRYHLRTQFNPEVIEALCNYNWPGNVRQLMNLVERLVVTAPRSVIDLDQLPAKYTASPLQDSDQSVEVPPLKEAVRKLEESLVERAMQHSATREEAASRLGISLSSLTRRLRRSRQCH
jgi:transcriptional regulator with PAS, ATPase and Fis domain